jgi:hypothetical protein
MHYTTIDPPPPPNVRFNRTTTMRCTTIDPQKSKIRTQDHRSTPPLPPLTSKSQRFEPKTMHYTTIDHESRNVLYHDMCTCTLIMQLAGFKLTIAVIRCIIQLASKPTSRLFRPFLSWQYIFHVYVYHSQGENRSSVSRVVRISVCI